MGKHFEDAGVSGIKYLLKGGQACDLHKNTYPAIIGILGHTINARPVELGEGPKKSHGNDEGTER